MLRAERFLFLSKHYLVNVMWKNQMNVTRKNWMNFVM